MSRSNYLFTSESVSEGHPDKVCDQISDAILDAFIANDVKLGIADDSLVNTRLGCETLCTTNKIVIAGEGRGQSPLFNKHGEQGADQSRADRADRARCGQGHRLRPGRLFVPRRRCRGAAARPVARHRDGRRCQEEEKRRAGRRRRPGHDVRLRLHRERRSTRRARSCRPRSTSPTRSSRCCRTSAAAGQIFDLQPDAKSQVTVKYVDGKPVGCTKVVVSTQHNAQHAQRQEVHAEHGQGPDRRRGRVGAAQGLDAEEGAPTSSSIRPAISSSADRTATAG